MPSRALSPRADRTSDRPLPSGIETSTTMTSGRVRRSMSSPSPTDDASPTTVRSGSESIRRAMPARTSVWSSMMTTEMSLVLMNAGGSSPG